MKKTVYLIMLIFIFLNASIALAALEKKEDSYYFSEHKMDVDMETFEQLAVFWSKDKNKVFYKWYETIVVDPESFEVINYEFGKDKYNVYWNSQFFEGTYIIKDVDPKTFEFIKGFTYAKDISGSFYIELYAEGGPSIKRTESDDAEILGSGYSRDGSFVYYKNDIVEGADPETFKIFTGSVTTYAVDYNYIYCGGKKIENSDSNTFEIMDSYEAKDKNNLYSGCSIKEGDPETYVQLSGNYKKDANNVFFGNSKLPGADPDTFEIIREIYGKDKNNVYYMHFLLEGMEPNEFVYLDHGYSKDNGLVYYLYDLVEGADPETITPLEFQSAKDKNYLYNKNVKVEKNFSEKIAIKNRQMYTRLKGKIMIKVEDSGKAYYVNPKNETIHYLGRPNDAFNVMKEQGIGISENDYALFGNYVPSRLSGAILLRVEANGEAYYVNPSDNKLYFLGRPADAFGVMRNLGLGVSNDDFNSL